VNELRARLRAWTRELDPPGFSDNGSGAVRSYFDHYFDGKPQVLTAEVRANAAAKAGLSGKTQKNVEKGKEKKGKAGGPEKANADIAPFTARNAVVKRGPKGVEIRAKKDRTRPFLVLSQLELDGAFEVELAFGAPAAGAYQVAWRSQGQDAFPEEQVAEQVRDAKDAGALKIHVPAQGKTIHLRLILPVGETPLQSVRVGKRVFRFHSD